MPCISCTYNFYAVCGNLPAALLSQLPEPSWTEQAGAFFLLLPSPPPLGQLEPCVVLKWAMKEGMREGNHRNCGSCISFY